MLSDGLESGAFGAWSTVTSEGGATTTVDASAAQSGRCSGRFQIQATSTSRANITRELPAGSSDVWADGWFRVDAQGGSASNVGFFRLFDGPTRIADVYRQNVTGTAWFRTRNASGGIVYTPLGIDLSLNRWYHVRFHVRANGSASTIEVWIDGVRRYSSTSFWLSTTRLTTLLLGSEHVAQQMDLRFDDIVLEAG